MGNQISTEQGRCKQNITEDNIVVDEDDWKNAPRWGSQVEPNSQSNLTVGQGRCIQTIIEDGVLQFEAETIYELVRYENGEIQGLSEQGLYVTVSDSGNWKFRDYFNIIV